MQYEVCSYQMNKLVSSEIFPDRWNADGSVNKFSGLTGAMRAFYDACFTLSTDRVVIWEASTPEDGVLVKTDNDYEMIYPTTKIIREALITDLENGDRKIVNVLLQS